MSILRFNIHYFFVDNCFTTFNIHKQLSIHKVNNSYNNKINEVIIGKNPNIELEDGDATEINIDIAVVNTELIDDVIIYLDEDLPECPDCEASLTLTSEYYELPAGDDNEIVTTQITTKKTQIIFSLLFAGKIKLNDLF